MSKTNAQKWAREMLSTIEEGVPIVPNAELRLAIRRCRVDEEDAEQRMEDWNTGKRLQSEGHPVPYAYEDEHATGYYNRVIRPQILALVKKELAMQSLEEWIAEEG